MSIKNMSLASFSSIKKSTLEISSPRWLEAAFTQNPLTGKTFGFFSLSEVNTSGISGKKMAELHIQRDSTIAGGSFCVSFQWFFGGWIDGCYDGAHSNTSVQLVQH